ncbi:hypothetical protein DFP72DRAFT_1062713 [Ephemerocybe angulata]|uniref:Uncharacterized protein n=1 Tax=Ephemerocybe angulata TaxID=980116 RepID=A0A8H6IBW4_9AGAR|nr:hypothetical protein DFP72DRAFT_1062713 [Tulosesus angulatus]
MPDLVPTLNLGVYSPIDFEKEEALCDMCNSQFEHWVVRISFDLEKLCAREGDSGYWDYREMHVRSVPAFVFHLPGKAPSSTPVEEEADAGEDEEAEETDVPLEFMVNLNEEKADGVDGVSVESCVRACLEGRWILSRTWV